MKKIKIVFLYSVYVHYVSGVIEKLVSSGDVSVDVVYWDKKNINSSRYLLEDMEGVIFHPRSIFSRKNLHDFLSSIHPDIIYISGWMDKDYVHAVRSYKKTNKIVQVVCGIDDQWKGTTRQRVGQVYFKLFLRKLYDYMWVSGKPQYHYAQRFGYSHDKIISNLLSANTSIFNKKSHATSKRFVFVGRFDPVKGLELLVNAYLSLPEPIQRDWKLLLIGDGEQRDFLINISTGKNIQVKPFMQPKELVEELSNGGVFCLPSYNEQWGVTVHELALLGYPMILSSACGAATEFLIHSYNGYLFNNYSHESLRSSLYRIAQLSSGDLQKFSTRSVMLANRINSEMSAYSLLSVIR